MTINELVYEEIHKSLTGITSSKICDMHPEIPRGTITSAVAKLRHKGRVVSEVVGKEALLFSDKVHAMRMAIPPEYNQRKRLDKDVRTTLKPFAEFARLMLKNSPTGNSSVWLSATTQTPTVQLAEGKWFLDALELFNTLEG